MRIRMLIRILVPAVLTAGGIGWSAASAGAQQLATLPPSLISRQYEQQDPRHTNVLDATLDVDLVQAPIKAVLDEVTRKTGVRFLYSYSVVPTDRRVSVRGRAITVRAVLQAALAGTGTEVQLTDGGKVAIVRSQAAKAADGVIAGKVIHAKTGQPVAGATVILGEHAKGIVTGSDGTFRIPVPSGEHALLVRAVGFVREQQKVTVTGEQTVTVEIVLEPSASVLNEVVVTGTVVATERKAIATPITVITAEEIEKRGITRIEQLFRGQVPGVIALESGSRRYEGQLGGGAPNLGGMESTTLFARGGSTLVGGANPMKTYIDGVEVVDPAYLGTIDPQSIERIELIAGPQAATIYGSGAMGGVMQIFTKRGTFGKSWEIAAAAKMGVLESNISQSLTPLHQHSVRVDGSPASNLSYSGNLSYNYTGQWQPKLFTSSTGAMLGIISRQEVFTMDASISLRQGRTGTNDGTGLFSSPVMRQKLQSGEYQKGDSYSYLNVGAGRVSSSASQTLAFNAQYRTAANWQHNLTVGKSTTEFVMHPKAPALAVPYDTLFQHGQSLGARQSLSYNSTWLWSSGKTVSSTLTFGANRTFMSSRVMNGCSEKKNSTNYIECARGIGEFRVASSLNEMSWGGFASWRIGIIDRLYVTLGLRGEKHPNYGDKHAVDWTPTNGIAYSLDAGPATIKLFGSYGRATRPPTSAMQVEVISQPSPSYDPASWVSQFANSYLTPEYSRGPQGGIELYYGSYGSFTINRYIQRISDLIQSVVVDSLAVDVLTIPGVTQKKLQRQYLNTGDIRQHGWEATAGVNIRMLSLKGTYTWMDSRALAYNQGCTSCREAILMSYTFRGVPTHTANITAGVSQGSTSATFVANYVGTFVHRYSGGMVYWDNVNARLSEYTERRRTTTGPMGVLIPGYWKSDLMLLHHLTPRVSFTANINNVGDSYDNDEIRGMYPSLGRQTLIGLSLKM